MDLSVHLGWWMLPTALTLVILSWLVVWEISQPQDYGYGAIGGAIKSIFYWGLWIIVMLIIWLSYFIAV